MKSQHKFDLIPGTQHDVLILLIIGLGVIYAGTGGWTRERSREALTAAGPPIVTLLFGFNRGRKEGYEEGYETYNPDAHPKSAAGAAWSRAGKKVATEPAPSEPAVAPAPAPPNPAPQLPPGWKYDTMGRVRDSSGRIASKKRTLETLARG